jgi:hypothetical protein
MQTLTRVVSRLAFMDSSSHRDPVLGLKRAVSLSIIVFLVCANAPYIWLIEHFDYDDILREPAGVILQRFHDGGDALVLAWFVFAMGSLLFIPVALGFRALVRACGLGSNGAELLGVTSAVAQAAGLLRWVFVIPALAATYVAPGSTAATRDAVVTTFDAVHRFGGMIVGEMLGQLLLAGWTVLTLIQLRTSGMVPTWLQLIGALTLPLWLLGQTELLHQVMPGVPAFELVPAAFILWETWLALVAVILLVGARPVPAGSAA